MRKFVLICGCLMLSLLPGGAFAEAIVNAAFVKQAVARGAIVWDVRPRADYLKGHVAGAVNLGEAAVELRDSRSEDFIARGQIERKLGAAGIDPAREIVVYGWRGSTTPYFARYLLGYFGAGNVRVFHDGIEGWIDAGERLQLDEARRQALRVALSPVPGVAVGTDELIALIGTESLQLVDTRSRKEFLGEDVRAIRGGHVPGAVNLPYELNWQDPDAALSMAKRQVRDTGGMSLKPREQLQAVYSRLDPERMVVVMCHSGVRAAQTLAVLQDLGFRDVRLYDSSWMGYALRLDAPAENEVFIDVVEMQQRIRDLTRQVEELKRRYVEGR